MNNQTRQEEMRCAAGSIKKLRMESKVEWDGAKEIRKGRDATVSPRLL
ncbi:MAG: hypothetical protein M1540_09775 [Candidatus Bathyarchaeota archaeon]|nr:hypothetical protein [Candidatus Bathyarchaeota archaeon]